MAVLDTGLKFVTMSGVLLHSLGTFVAEALNMGALCYMVRGAFRLEGFEELANNPRWAWGVSALVGLSSAVVLGNLGLAIFVHCELAAMIEKARWESKISPSDASRKFC
jgi:hypothetical protein